MPRLLLQDGSRKKTLDPILTLRVSQDHQRGATTEEGAVSASSAITSLCFLNSQSADPIQEQHESSDDSDSDDDEDLNFRCRELVANEKQSDQDVTAPAREIAASMSLIGRLLGTCHLNGNTFLWDLGQRKSIRPLMTTNQGTGTFATSR